MEYINGVIVAPIAYVSVEVALELTHQFHVEGALELTLHLHAQIIHDVPNLVEHYLAFTPSAIELELVPVYVESNQHLQAYTHLDVVLF